MLLLSVTLPLVMFLLVDQVYRYDHMLREIDALQERQAALFEENKRTVVNIAILKAPERIDRLARELGLEKGIEQPLIEISLPSRRRPADG